MTFKQPQRKIAWKKITLVIALPVSVSTAIYGLVYLFETKAKSQAERNKKYEIQQTKKTNDMISKKFDITCDNKIITPQQFNIIKVSDNYRVILNNTTELDKTYRLSKCDVIYKVEKEIK